MILIDYSQVSLANILSFSNDLIRGSEEEIINIVRHTTLSTIKSYKKRYGKEYGEVVICCDGRKYWRRDAFPHYKAGRKKARDKSELNWSLIFDTLATIREDLKEHFPYKVVHLENTEADDIIATLTKWTQENQLVEVGLMQEPQKVLIISSDKDFKQLHKYGNVRQWSPMLKKYVESPRDTSFLQEHIVRGDSGDGIPNIFSKDDVFVQGERQKIVRAERLAEFMEKGIDACRNDEERRNYQRNVSLIDLDYIPEDICNSIISEYENQKPKGDKMSIMNYLIKNRCRLLLDDIQEF